MATSAPLLILFLIWFIPFFGWSFRGDASTPASPFLD